MRTLTSYEEELRTIIIQLSTQPADAVESETLEIKGWCVDEKQLAEKASEASACLANAHGGTVLLGIPDSGVAQFSRCPHQSVTKEWIQKRVSDLTLPPVECSVFDATDIVEIVTGTRGLTVYAIKVPKSKCISGHLTSGGLSRIRSGKECKPNYASLQDDRSAQPFQGISISDLDKSSIQWAIGQAARRHGIVSDWESEWDFLRHIRAVQQVCSEEDDLNQYSVSLACFLFFGKETALSLHLPAFETLIISPAGTTKLSCNIVESFRKMCGSRNAILATLCPLLPLDSIRELVANAYMHRCYRTNGPIIIRIVDQRFEIENPGELPAGLRIDNLIHCIPIYRNLLLADIGRLTGISDKIGQGIKKVYKDVLEEGFTFPLFESTHDRFTARVYLEATPEFKEFVRVRAQALSQLDEIVILRFLWSRTLGTVPEIACCMQRGKEWTEKVLESMFRKSMVEPLSNEAGKWQLNPSVRSDIRDVFKANQMSMNKMLWGDEFPEAS